MNYSASENDETIIIKHYLKSSSCQKMKSASERQISIFEVVRYITHDSYAISVVPSFNRSNEFKDML